MAEHRHKRDTTARRKPRAAIVAAPLALLATAGAVTIGVLASTPVTAGTMLAKDAADISSVAPTRDTGTVSRAETRRAAVRLEKAHERRHQIVVTRAAVRKADTRLWATTDLNLWTGSDKDAKQAGEIETGKRVLVTGRKAADREEVVIDGKPRWVTAGYLSDEKPVAAAAGLSMAQCPDPSVESGLTSDAVYVYRSVCHAFPQITSYGGWDGHGEHSSGRALDIMTSDVTLGNAIADFLLQHAGELDLYDIIWRGQIWTSVRSGEGWRSYGDHGSATANHYDHVHVATN